MNLELSNLVNLLNEPTLTKASVIGWGSPVVSFGDLSSAKVATVGLNPSNREFVDTEGQELNGAYRRFHTLKSLGIQSWKEVDGEAINLILELCKEYFNRNPYDGWFKKLDYIISGTTFSYYFPSNQACHLDLIPYATSCKWTELTVKQRDLLLEISGDTLGSLIKNSRIELLVLNGKTVVENFNKMTDVNFDEILMNNWTLPRKSGQGVAGYAFKGVVEKIGDIDLNRKITVLGYNHNIQSSFGVTSKVLSHIRKWISETANEILE